MRQNWLSGKWQVVEYRKTMVPGFRFWSGLFMVDHDRQLVERTKTGNSLKCNFSDDGLLDWLKKVFFWKKCAVVELNGKIGTKYRIGFFNPLTHVCKISPEVRTFNNDSFALRVGPVNNRIFVIAESQLEIEAVAYTYDNSKSASSKYAKVVIY